MLAIWRVMRSEGRSCIINSNRLFKRCPLRDHEPNKLYYYFFCSKKTIIVQSILYSKSKADKSLEMGEEREKPRVSRYTGAVKPPRHEHSRHESSFHHILDRSIVRRILGELSRRDHLFGMSTRLAFALVV